MALFLSKYNVTLYSQRIAHCYSITMSKILPIIIITFRFHVLFNHRFPSPILQSTSTRLSPTSLFPNYSKNTWFKIHNAHIHNHILQTRYKSTMHWILGPFLKVKEPEWRAPKGQLGMHTLNHVLFGIATAAAAKAAQSKKVSA